MPDAVTEPILHDLVNKFQVHRSLCLETCLTRYKKGNRILEQCRFGFPFKPQAKTVLQEKTGLFDDPMAKKKTYLLKRDKSCAYVNAYNPALLLCWRGNVDVQYLGEHSQNNLEYVTGYVGKGESKTKLDLADFGTRLNKTDLIKLALRMMKMREMGMPEIYDRLLGQHLYDSDCSVLYLNNNPPEKRTRIMKGLSELQNNPNDRPFANNLYDVYYLNRPDELENCCIFTVFTTLNYSKKKPGNTAVNSNLPNRTDLSGTDSEDENDADNLHDAVQDSPSHTQDSTSPFYLFPKGSVFQLKNGVGWWKAKTKAILARFWLPDLSSEDPETLEDHSRRVLFMFKPWRNENTDLKESHETYSEALQEFWENCSTQCRQDIQILLKRTQELYDAVRERNEEEKARRELMREQDIEEEVEAIEMAPRLVDAEQVQRNMNSLNSDQKKVFDDVMNCIERRVNGEEDPDKSSNMFVSGVAGTGKSHLIATLADAVTLQYTIPGRENADPPVILAAPTGLAAVNIGGNTLHSLLNIEVEHGKVAGFRGLRPGKLSELRVLFRNVKLLIIDEISMVSNIMLWKVEQRLEEITGVQKMFGGLLVLAFGDLLQLPPVRVPEVFLRLKDRHAKQIFKTIPVGLDLWAESFSYQELTINMRQRDDLAYSELMNRVRIGSLTSTDVNSLLGRYITVLTGRTDGETPTPATLEQTGAYYLKLLENDSKVLAVFCKTKTVLAFNNFIVKQLELTTGELAVKIPAIEERVHRVHKSGTLHRPWLKKGMRMKDVLSDEASSTLYHTTEEGVPDPAETKRAGGLTKLLLIQRKSRVMLTYVATSRARALGGLHLIALHIPSIRASHRAVEEYNRLGDTISMEHLSAHNELPELAEELLKTKNKNWLSVFLGEQPADQITSGDGELVRVERPPAKKPARKTAAPRKKAPKKVLPTVEEAANQQNQTNHLLLENGNGTMCFCNSVVQCLRSSSVKQDIVAPEEEENSLYQLSTLINSTGLTSSRTLLSYFDGRHGRTDLSFGQQDVSEFFDQLLPHLPQQVQNQYTFLQQLRCVCGSCNNETLGQVEEFVMLSLTCPPSSPTLTISFADLIQHQTNQGVVLTRHCDVCGIRTEHTEQKLITVPETCNHLVMTMPLFVYHNMRLMKTTIQLSPGPRAVQPMFESRWRLTSSIEHKGASPTHGHYEAWVRNDDGWDNISDTTVRSSRRMKKFMSNMYMMFFDRV